MFAIITPALISGAVAERIRFEPYCLFLILWIDAGLLPAGALGVGGGLVDAAVEAASRHRRRRLARRQLGALDFAGGTVVHIAAGLSGLAAILVLRKRLGYPEHAMHPNSMVLTLTGAGLLWFGWFGFNGGSALASGGLAASAFAATQVRRGRGGPELDARPNGCTAASRPRWAWRPASSPAWSPSRRRPASSRRGAACASA